MDKIIFVLLAVISGCMFGMQASVNGALGKRIGVYESSFISVLTSTIILLILLFLFGKGNLTAVKEVPKWQLLGGIFGAIIVTAMVISVPRIGGASAVFAVIFGQMCVSLIIDHYGLFEIPVMKFDGYRFAGIIFMLIGLVLIFKNNLDIHV